MSTAFLILHYSMLAFSAGISIYALLRLKQTRELTDVLSNRSDGDIRGQVRDIQLELEALKKELDRMGRRSEPAALTTRALGPAVRIQALRMIQRGEGAEKIASSLGLPPNEIELFVKVQRLLLEQPMPPS